MFNYLKCTWFIIWWLQNF